MAAMLIAIINLVGFVITIALLLRVLFSWINVSPYQNQFAGLVYRLTDPILAPIRKVLPSMGMLDLSPMVALIGINFLQQILVQIIYSAMR